MGLDVENSGSEVSVTIVLMKKISAKNVDENVVRPDVKGANDFRRQAEGSEKALSSRGRGHLT